MIAESSSFNPSVFQWDVGTSCSDFNWILNEEAKLINESLWNCLKTIIFLQLFLAKKIQKELDSETMIKGVPPEFSHQSPDSFWEGGSVTRCFPHLPERARDFIPFKDWL